LLLRARKTVIKQGFGLVLCPSSHCTPTPN